MKEKWFHCYGWPTQMEDGGLIMMDDLPKWKKWWSYYDGWPTQMKNKKRSHYNGWPTQLKSKRRSHCNGRPTQMEDNGLIMMGDLPRCKLIMVSLWWVTYPDGRKVVSLLWVTYPDGKWKVVSLLWVTYLENAKIFFSKEMVSLLWVTYPDDRMWLTWQKTWQAKSWQDKADKRRFLIARFTWRLLLLMIGLISSFLLDFSTGRVHLILYSFQDLNRFFVIIDSMILSVHNLAGLHWGFSCNKFKNLCNFFVRMICMHPYLIWNISPPSLLIHRHKVPLFAFQSLLCTFDALAHSCASHHSTVNAVPVLGYLRWLLLWLFIKLDNAPKCGVAWFIMKDFLS